VLLTGAARAQPPRLLLGRMLFMDVRLSSTHTVSCATCHDPERAFSGHAPDGRPAPSLFNLDRSPVGPLRKELHLTSLPPDVAHLPEYQEAYQTAYGGPPTWARTVDALSAFLRSLHSTDAPYDRGVRGPGWHLFQQSCIGCHQVASLRNIELIDPALRLHTPLPSTQVAQLKAFLRTLTGQHARRLAQHLDEL
jgi:cytochrome c peroxidase